MIGRIYQLSDIHFGVENKDAVQAALDHCHETPPDLVLITGDITQQGFQDEFEAAARWIKAMPEPVFVTVGNHDVPYWNAYDRVFQPWKRFETTTGHPAHDHQFENDKLMVRGVTTARGWQARLNWSKGVIDLDQTRRAAEALAATPRDHLRVLACHHPLIEMIGAPMTGEVKRGRAAAEIFAGRASTSSPAGTCMCPSPCRSAWATTAATRSAAARCPCASGAWRPASTASPGTRPRSA